MAKLRIVTAIAAAFVVSQISTAIIHGFLLAADYAAYRGVLLRSEAAWPMLFLPVAHLSFVSALTWAGTRLILEGSVLARGMALGILGWATGQVPLWLIWYAQQPWPGYLVVKQLGFELLSSVAVGLAIAAVLRVPARRAAAHQTAAAR